MNNLPIPSNAPLFNRIRAYLDGSTLTIFNADGSIVGTCDALGFQPCHTCGIAVGLLNRHSRGVLVRSKRICMQHEQPFCSSQCRDTWWRAKTDKPLFKVDTPATLEWFLCHFCQGGKEQANLVGVGEVLPKQEGRQLQITNRSEEPLSWHLIPNPTQNCNQCLNTRIYSPAPAFYYAEPGDFGWQQLWAGYDFDRNITTTVYDTEPGQIQLLWRVSETEWQMLPELIKEQWVFSNPHEFNKWWTEGLSLKGQRSISRQYKQLKQMHQKNVVSRQNSHTVA